MVVTGAAGFSAGTPRCGFAHWGGSKGDPDNHQDSAGETLVQAVTDADVVIHLAGISRASDSEIALGNLV